jgi:uncharacterized protein (DUF2252 family)
MAKGISETEWLSADEARERGRALRETTPFDAHGEFTIRPGRPTVAQFVAASNSGRLETLVPLRISRMSATPFAFYRGSAGLMAHDLADDPVTGVDAQICGDAHASNFGLYGTRDGRIVMDINDFDETMAGPWEWDLKRLAASLVLAGRGGNGCERSSLRAARHAVRSYRRACAHMAEIPFLDSWNALADESAIDRADADALLDDFDEASAKAVQNTSAKVATRWTRRGDDGTWRFLANPPILTPVADEERALVIDSLAGYADTLRQSRQVLLRRYRPRDAAMRVVGTGSVGLRSYIVLLEGNRGEALILQVKQAQPSALAPYLPPAPPMHEGERIVHGASLVQVETDLLLGWTTIAGVPYIVRQFRNRKGEINPTALAKDDLDDYGRVAGSLLARAHSRTLDPRMLAGYLEDGKEFDRAVTRYAAAYADQVTKDHADLLAAVADGVLPTMVEPD